MSVHLSVSPPDGYEAWDEAAWDAWLTEHPWEPATRVCDRADWLVFLYMARVHAPRAQDDLAPFIERLIAEKGIHALEVDPLRDALHAVAAELGRVPASKLFTGTQFYSHADLDRYFADAEERTGKRGVDLTVSDLWTPVFEQLVAACERAREQGRGLYFGHV